MPSSRLLQGEVWCRNSLSVQSLEQGSRAQMPQEEAWKDREAANAPRLPPLQHVRHVLGAFQDRRVRAGSEGFLTATEGRLHRAKRFSVC